LRDGAGPADMRRNRGGAFRGGRGDGARRAVLRGCRQGVSGGTILSRLWRPAGDSVRVGVVRVRQLRGKRCRFGTCYLFCNIAQSLAQMHAVAEHVCRALRAAEQECDDWLVSLYSVAALARQYEIVAPIVGTLAATRGHVVQGDGVLVVSEATVGADWPVLGEQPLSCLQVSASVSGEGGKLWF